ncbi:hypothetical protein M3Y99_00848200 [Aphelenchoides fujianensis]|nr:hypothetical protein M3Y99_00848200 [Aphelenchoides fujianensis]
MRSILGFVLILSLVSAELSNFDGRDDDDEEEEFESNYRGDHIQTSIIENSFNNQRSFACQLVKNALRTGDSGANLSPEDIKVVAAMGDSLSTGLGLWGGMDIEFRGAAFTIGGDATIDGLVTFPNILSAFSPHLAGFSHGMGTAKNLPDHQFDVAEQGAETETMPEQAKELERWVMVIMTIGTDEMCKRCDKPDVKGLRSALVTLRKALPKAFVVVIGPVARCQVQPRCPCLNRLTNKELRQLQSTWKDALLSLEVEFSSRNYTTFPVVMLPRLSIESRRPEELFIAGHSAIEPKGTHLRGQVAVESPDLWPEVQQQSSAVERRHLLLPSGLSCSIMTLDEFERRQAEKAAEAPTANRTASEIHRDEIRGHIGWWIAVPVVLSFIVVVILGTGFYAHGMKATHGRFENVPGV